MSDSPQPTPRFKFPNLSALITWGIIAALVGFFVVGGLKDAWVNVGDRLDTWQGKRQVSFSHRFQLRDRHRIAFPVHQANIQHVLQLSFESAPPLEVTITTVQGTPVPVRQTSRTASAVARYEFTPTEAEQHLLLVNNLYSVKHRS